MQVDEPKMPKSPHTRRFAKIECSLLTSSNMRAWSIRSILRKGLSDLHIACQSTMSLEIVFWKGLWADVKNQAASKLTLVPMPLIPFPLSATYGWTHTHVLLILPSYSKIVSSLERQASIKDCTRNKTRGVLVASKRPTRNTSNDRSKQIFTRFRIIMI